MRQTDLTLTKYFTVKRFCLCLVILFISSFLYAQNIPQRPNPPHLVNDLAGVLSPEQEQILEDKLVALDDSTSNQIAIVLIKSLDDYPIEDYSLKILRGWGIGSKKNNNGVLILASIDDHKVRIETGYGLEGAIPDITADNIIENDIVPAFKQENFYQGLNAATDDLIKAAAGEYHDVRQTSDDNTGGKGGGSLLGIIIIIIIILIVIRRGGGGKGGGMMSRRGYGGLGPFILGNMLGNSLGGGSRGGWGNSGGGGWSGGGGGGGFGGFGGGGGGGGGASGSW